MGKKRTKPAAVAPARDAFSIELKKIVEKIKVEREGLYATFNSPRKNKGKTLPLQNKQSVFIDKNIKKIATLCARKTAMKHPPTLIATGGYGRGELAPYSDIDLLILSDKPFGSEEKKWLESLTAACWQAGLKLSYSLRSLHDCAAAMTTDVHFMTSLLETRFIWGRKSLFRDLEKNIRQHLNAIPASTFIAAKLTERDQRHHKTGDSRAVLQPNVKESKGGLRDIQTLFWLSNFLFGIQTADGLVKHKILTRDEARNLAAAHDFFWSVRIHLHLLAGRADDRLTFDAQPDIARRMGYDDDAPHIRAEKFMKDYFRMAYATGYLTRILCADLESRALSGGATAGSKKIALSDHIDGFPVTQNRLNIQGHKGFEDTPSDMVRIFRASQTSGFDIHPDALRKIRTILSAKPSCLQNDKTALALFLDIMLERKAAAQTLRRMNEAEILTALIPDFANIFAHMQYDMYHVFTADEHTINAIDILHKIENGQLEESAPLATELIQTIQARRMLFCAILYHDMAKGTGGEHALKGAEIVRRMCPLMGLDAAETETAAWLVEYHLLMTMTALKRDLNDPKTITDFTDTVQSPERLRLLTIMTTADIMAVGPDRWNNWKSGLITDLYHRAKHILSGTPSLMDDTGQAMIVQKKVRRMIGEKTAALRYLTDRTPKDFWLAFPAETLAAFVSALHKDIARNKPTVIRVSPAPAGDFTEVFVFTPDKKGLFAALSGAIAAGGASIVDARIFTLPDGMALDVFQVQDLNGHAFENTTYLQKTIKATLAGTLRLDEEMAQRQKTAPKRGKSFAVPTRIIIDNNASASQTLIEINAKDRPGFLYDVTSTLTALGLQITAAKVTTFGSRAVDVFYVKDSFGLKVIHPEKQTRIEQALKNALEKNPQPHL